MQWIALLEFSHNKEVAELSWQNMDRSLPRTDKLREMVRHGIPHSLRPQIWMRMSGKTKIQMLEKQSYEKICLF